MNPKLHKSGASYRLKPQPRDRRERERSGVPDENGRKRQKLRISRTSLGGQDPQEYARLMELAPSL